RVLSSNPMSDWAEKLEATYQDLNLKFEGGESSSDAMKRIVSVVEDICESDSENAVIVAHGGILTLLLYFYTPHFSFDRWEGMSNPDVYLLKRSEGKNEVKRIWEEVSSSVLEYKMTKCTSKWTTFFILTYIPNYIQNDL